MKFRFSGRAVVLTSIAVVITLVLGAGVSYLFLQKSPQVQKFPALKNHIDLSIRPMETFASSQKITLPSDNSTFVNSSCPTLSPTWVKDENQKPGVNMTASDWKNLDLSAVEGSGLWLNQTSVSCGAQVKIHAALYSTNNTPQTSGPRIFAAWRIGYYNGAGAREVWRSSKFKLKKRKAITSKKATRMTDTNWPVTTSFTVGKDWTPGFYLIISFSPFGQIENAAPLIVRSPIGSSKLVMMQSFMTWQMYNSFGGRSAYLGPDVDGTPDADERSRVISFDRPMMGSGSYSIQRDAIPFIQFTEQHGINMDHVTDLDINDWPSITTKYNGIIVGGHAEYLTHRIFNTFIADRNLGTNIAVFGGNTAFWQTRLAASPIGSNRRMIMYKSSTEDPTTSLNLVSIEFSNKRLNTPPNLITGEQTDGVHVYGTLSPMSIPAWLHIKKTATISGVSSDSEVEAATPNVAQPPNVHIIYSGRMFWRDPIHDKAIKGPPIAQVDWIGFPSGSAVFNAGMSTWSCQLSNSCVDLPFSPSSQTLMRSITLQVLNLWQAPKIGAFLK